MSDFTCDFTGNLKNSLNSLFKEFKENKMVCVEIGSFEGRGSIVIHDFLCKNEESILYCIVPFDNEYVKGNEKMSFWDSACKGQLDRFRTNTKGYSKIVEWKGTSEISVRRQFG